MEVERWLPSFPDWVRFSLVWLINCLSGTWTCYHYASQENLSTELICTSTHRPSSIHVPSSKKSKEGSRSVMLVVTLKGRRRYLATSLTPQAYKIQPNTIPLCAFQKTKIAQRLESNVHCIESNHGTRKNLSPSLSTDCWSTLCIRWAQGCHRWRTGEKTCRIRMWRTDGRTVGHVH
jgi:hypothetical protein